MNEPKKVNLSAKKTEAEWGKAMDDFFLYSTPIWFEWLKWIAITGVLQVAAAKTHDVFIQFAIIIIFFLYILHGRVFQFS
jgi:hypothetical protein